MAFMMLDDEEVETTHATHTNNNVENNNDVAPPLKRSAHEEVAQTSGSSPTFHCRGGNGLSKMSMLAYGMPTVQSSAGRLTRCAAPTKLAVEEERATPSRRPDVQMWAKTQPKMISPQIGHTTPTPLYAAASVATSKSSVEQQLFVDGSATASHESASSQISVSRGSCSSPSTQMSSPPTSCASQPASPPPKQQRTLQDFFSSMMCKKKTPT